MPPKKAAAKPAAKSPAKKKAAAAKAAPKAKAKPAKAAAAPKAKAANGSAAAEFQARLARAEEAAQRAAELERQLADRENELEGERSERLAAVQRLGELEARLADSASAVPDEPEPPSDPHDAQLQARIAELQAELDRREEEIRTLQQRAPSTDILTCPRCRGEMVEFMHLGVTLDRCNDCAGLFFDSGELQEVLKREYPDPEPQAPIEVAAEVPVPEEAPKRKGFFRSLFSRKTTPPEAS
jgi:hypothetical protein